MFRFSLSIVMLMIMNNFFRVEMPIILLVLVKLNKLVHVLRTVKCVVA